MCLGVVEIERRDKVRKDERVRRGGAFQKHGLTLEVRSKQERTQKIGEKGKNINARWVDFRKIWQGRLLKNQLWCSRTPARRPSHVGPHPLKSLGWRRGLSDMKKKGRPDSHRRPLVGRRKAKKRKRGAG